LAGGIATPTTRPPKYNEGEGRGAAMPYNKAVPSLAPPSATMRSGKSSRAWLRDMTQEMDERFSPNNKNKSLATGGYIIGSNSMLAREQTEDLGKDERASENQQRLDTLNGRRFFDESEPIAVRLAGSDTNPEIKAALAYAGLPKRGTKTELGVLLVDCERILHEIGELKNLSNAIKFTTNARDRASISFTPLPESGAPVVLVDADGTDEDAEDEDARPFLKELVVGTSAAASSSAPARPVITTPGASPMKASRTAQDLNPSHLQAALDVDSADLATSVLARTEQLYAKGARSRTTSRERAPRGPGGRQRARQTPVSAATRRDWQQQWKRADDFREQKERSWSRSALSSLKHSAAPSAETIRATLEKAAADREAAEEEKAHAELEKLKVDNEMKKLEIGGGKNRAATGGGSAEAVAEGTLNQKFMFFSDREWAAEAEGADAADGAGPAAAAPGPGGVEEDAVAADTEENGADEKPLVGPGGAEAGGGPGSGAEGSTKQESEGEAKGARGATSQSTAAAEAVAASDEHVARAPGEEVELEVAAEAVRPVFRERPRKAPDPNAPSFRFLALLLATRSVEATSEASGATRSAGASSRAGTSYQPFGAAEPIYVVKLSVDLWDDVLADVPREIWPLEAVPFSIVSPEAIAAQGLADYALNAPGAAVFRQAPAGAAEEAPQQNHMRTNTDNTNINRGDALKQGGVRRARLSAAEKVHHVLRYLNREVEIAAWPITTTLEGVMPKQTAASFHTSSAVTNHSTGALRQAQQTAAPSKMSTPISSTVCLTKPGDYQLNAVFPETDSLYLVGKAVDVSCLDVNQHAQDIEDLRLELSSHCSLKSARYPFYVLPWDECRNWVKLKSHENCLDDGSVILYEQIEHDAAERELVVIYVSHEYARSNHPDNERGDVIKALQKYGRSLVSQYDDQIDLFFYFDYCCTEQHRHFDHQQKESLDCGYLWNCNWFLALVPSLMNEQKQIQGMESYARDPKCQSELFASFLSGLRHAYWTDGEVGGRLDFPPRYPACWCTHLAAKLALYAQLLTSEDLELDKPFVPKPIFSGGGGDGRGGGRGAPGPDALLEPDRLLESQQEQGLTGRRRPTAAVSRVGFIHLFRRRRICKNKFKS